jgi:hypothetical protein
MTAIDDIRAQLDYTSSVIEDFRRIVGGGTPVDLTGLDGSVAAMCAAIAQLPPDQRPGFRSVLIRLMDEMDALVASLRQQQESIAQELKGVSSRHQAVSAYGRGGGAGPRGSRPRK